MTESDLNTVRTDMRSLAKDAKDLYQEANDATGEKADALRAKGANLLNSVLTKAKSAQSSVVGTSKDLALTTDDYVQGNPWKAIAISAGVGLLAGVLLARK